MPAPLIGITGYSRSMGDFGPFGAGIEHESADIFVRSYARGVQRAGGIPVLLTRESDPDAVMSRLDGLLLSGGADINPERYAQKVDGSNAPDDERDAFELALLASARAKDLPVLGVCRGCQLLNVYYGGTLVQDLPRDEIVHPRYTPDARLAQHGVTVEEGSVLASLYPSTLDVNSRHHQAVDRLGEGLRVNARAIDGVIEGIERPGEPVLAVQWHPEAMGPDQVVFNWLVREAQQRLA
jgi:putative glutamine amidotransferase